MKKLGPVGLLAAFALLASAGGCGPNGPINFETHAGSCKVDDQIDVLARTELENAAMAMAKAVLASDFRTAYAQLGPEAQATINQDEFANTLRSNLIWAGPFTPPKPEHTYIPSVAGTGSQPVITICDDASPNEKWVAVSALPGADQGHVSLTTTTRNNGWTITEWLVKENGRWSVRTFNSQMTSMGGHTYLDLWRLAKAQAAKGHRFNAALLYVGANILINRGPNIQLGEHQDLENEIKRLPIPPELAGKLPHLWLLNGRSYKITAVSISGVDQMLNLSVRVQMDAWKDDSDTDRQNRILIKDFLSAHPEFTEAFSILTIRAEKPDRTGGYGTVWQAGKGVLAPTGRPSSTSDQQLFLGAPS